MRGKTLARSLCKVSSDVKFTRFPASTILQHCKLLSADFSPPYRFNCLWAFSFHLQFHDLRLVLERRDFVDGKAGEVNNVRNAETFGFHLAGGFNFTLFKSCLVTAFGRRGEGLGNAHCVPE